MALSREQIVAGAKRYKTKTVEVHCPGLADPDSGDDVVLVRGLSQTEFDAHQMATRIMTDKGEQIGIDESNISAKIAVRVVVDSKGERLLTEGDATYLGEASPADVTQIVNKAMELAGMAPGGEPSEETKGNSDATQDGETSSGSPENTEQPPPSSSDDSMLAAV